MNKLGDSQSTRWAPSSGAPTRAKVLRAKREAVGGRRKRCMRGKNCSAACIQAGMVCLVEFPLPVSDGLTQARNALLDYISKKNNLQPGSIQEKRVNAALTQLSNVLSVEGRPTRDENSRPAKPKVEWKRDQKRSERRALTWEEVQGLKKRKDLLGEAEVKEEATRALLKDALSRGLRLPRAELEMIYDAMPESTQKSLASSGRAKGGKWWGGKDEEGNDRFSRSATKERGIAVLDLWLRQGGTDAYQGRGGKIWAPQDLNIEHIRPLSQGGTDSPSNWILARAGAQQARGVKDLKSWVEKLPNSEREYKNYLSDYKSDKSKKRVKKAVLSALDPSQYSDKEVFGWGAAKSGKAFGARTLFTGEFQPIQNIKQGASRPNSGPPMPFAKATAIIAKTKGAEEAKAVVYELRNIWNKQLITDKSITPQEALQKMTQAVQTRLTPEQNTQLFQPAVQAWAKSRDVQSYGFLP